MRPAVHLADGSHRESFHVVGRPVDLISDGLRRSFELVGHEDDRRDGVRQLLVDVVQASAARPAGSVHVGVDDLVVVVAGLSRRLRGLVKVLQGKNRVYELGE